MRVEKIEKLRCVVEDCLSKRLCPSAIFFANKVATLAPTRHIDAGRHHRHAFHLRFRYLAAKFLEGLKEWDQCLLMLGDAKVDELGMKDPMPCTWIKMWKIAKSIEVAALGPGCHRFKSGNSLFA